MIPHPLAIASGVLYVLAFPPYGLAALSFVCLVPWLVLLMRGRHPRPLRQSLAFCCLITLLGFHWVGYVIQQFGGIPWPVAALGLLGFSFIGQLQIVAFAAFVPTLSRHLKRASPSRGLALLALSALLYTAIDYVLPKLFRDTLGHSWTGLPILRLNARWAGAYGLTFISTLVNLSIAHAISLWLDRDEPSAWPVLKKSGTSLLVSGALVLLCWLCGVSTHRELSALLKTPEATLPLSVIQANIGDIEKISAESGVREARRKVLDTFFDLSDRALSEAPRTQALIWPETSYPTTFGTPDFAEDLALDQQVETFAKSRKVGIFFGGYDQDKFLRKDYNAFFFLAPEARTLQTYRKSRLLLFGEEMPFGDLFPQLRRWFPQVGNFGRGAGPSAIELPTTPPTRAAPAICYEVLFADDMIEAKRKGAQWILNITNDSWFGPYAEPQLHLALSTFRSIELGIPMLRSTNTGISAWVDPLGVIHQPTRTFEPAILSLELPLKGLPKSPVERFGDWFPRLSLLAFGAWLRLSRRSKLS